MRIMPNNTPYFTVFTPTYNRAHTLNGVYESLCVQTFKDFEWIIVDDGSTDNTDELVSGWVDEDLVDIVYIKQKNQGKHVAHNTAVDNANGSLFLVFDSDDKCIPETLEIFRKYWEEIPRNVRSKYSTLSVLCMNQFGEIVGPEYPDFIIDSQSFSEQLKLRSGGERWGINTTESMRANKFPVYPGERFFPEGLVWNRLSKNYRARFVNLPLRIYEQQTDSLSKKTVDIRTRSPRGTLQYYLESMDLPLSGKQRLKNESNLVRFSFHAGDLSQIKKVITNDFMFLLSIPLGVVMFVSDAIRR